MQNDLSNLSISDKKMAGPLQGIKFLLVPILALIFFLAIISKLLSAPNKEETLKLQNELNTAKEAQSATENSALRATGYIVAQRSAAVSSKATGRLKELNVVAGDIVKKGDVLGVLDNEDSLAQVKEKEASIKVFDAALRSATSDLDQAKREYERYKKMIADKLISESEFDKISNRYLTAKAQVEAAQANLILSKAQYDRAKVEYGYTFILAPFDGTVLTKDAEVGEIVAPFGSTSSRAAIVTVADLTSMQVEADVSESYVKRIKEGDKCEIRLDSLPNKIYHGTVDKIVPTVDRSKATVTTKIKINDIDKDVLPEMRARVEFM